MLCYVMLCYVMLCYVMLCYVMLCYVMLCYVMLCYVMLCYVMLCYVMLCYKLFQISCVLKYEGVNGAAGTYAVTLTLEDFPAGTTNFSSVRPFSAVGLQFLVIINSHAGSCNDIPEFTASTPRDGECSEVQIGSEYTAVIEVQVAHVSKQ